jgi:hypothetical protein
MLTVRPTTMLGHEKNVGPSLPQYAQGRYVSLLPLEYKTDLAAVPCGTALTLNLVCLDNPSAARLTTVRELSFSWTATRLGLTLVLMSSKKGIDRGSVGATETGALVATTGAFAGGCWGTGAVKGALVGGLTTGALAGVLVGGDSGTTIGAFRGATLDGTWTGPETGTLVGAFTGALVGATGALVGGLAIGDLVGALNGGATGALILDGAPLVGTWTGLEAGALERSVGPVTVGA